jgi:hypothetical protein
MERENGESLGLYELSKTKMGCKRCMDTDYVTSETKPGTKKAKIYTHDLLGVTAEVQDFEQNKDGCRHSFFYEYRRRCYLFFSTAQINTHRRTHSTQTHNISNALK